MALGVEVDFTANVARFSSQIDRVTNDLNRFQTRAQSMASKVSGVFSAFGVGLSAAAFTGFLKKGIDDLDAINDMADRTGIAAETLAGFSGAVKLADTNMESFTAAANKLSINIAKNRDEFAHLGISARDPAEAFFQLADAVSKIEDPQERAALAAKALGKSYAEMMPLLMQTGDGLREMVEDFARTSGVTTKLTKEAADFNDRMDALGVSVRNLAVKAVGPLLGPLNELVGYLTSATDATNDLADANGDAGDSWISWQTGINTTIEFLAELTNGLRRAGLEISTFWEQTKALATLDFPRFQLIDQNYDKQVDQLNSDLDGLYKKVELGNKQAKIEIGTEKTGKELLELNDQILTTLNKIDALEAGGIKGGVVKSFGGDLDAENAKLQTQLKRRETLLQTYNSQGSELSKEVTLKTQIDTRGVLEAGDVVENTNRRISNSARGASRQVASSVDAIGEKFNQMAADLQKSIALSGEITEVDRVKYETAYGNLVNLTAAQKDYLIGLAEEKDRIESSNKAYKEKEQYIASLVSEFNAAEQEFETGLARTQDALNEGIIDVNVAKEKFDELGKAYNDSFIDPAKSGTEELSQFAIQGARNMQDAFADFLFDPFSGGVEGMVNGFADALRRMAANAVSAMIFDGLKSAFSGASSSAGGAGFLSWLGGLFGSGSAVGGGSAFAANGLAFDDGNILKFASGGIFDRPHIFKMAQGGIGMLGEAGPEAIMPLTRGPDGKLGVIANTTNRPSQNYNITVNVTKDSPPNVRRAASQGAQEAIALVNRASRYG